MTGSNFCHVVAKQIALEHGLAGVHPVDVAAQGVDFPVMRDVAVGMSAVPTGEGVGGKTGMDQGQGAFHRRVPEIGIKLIHLLGQEHPLIDQRAAGEAGNIKPMAARDPAVTDGALGIVCG